MSIAGKENVIRLSEFGNFSDGKKNAFEALKKCFEKSSEREKSVIVIEPGEYLVDSGDSIPLYSHTLVIADGAEFKFPENLGDNFIRRMFRGINVEDFTWQGGSFRGYVYDVNKKENLWKPYSFTGCICIYTKEGGCVKDIRIKNVTGYDVAGTVVSVEGFEHKKAENIDVKDCRFIRCARFMWDYGYLWQRVVFASEYDEASVFNALSNIPKEHISEDLTLDKDGGIVAEFMPKALPEERDAVTFFGKEMPVGIIRGKQYFVLNKGAENSLFISEKENGEPVKISAMPHNTRLFRDMFFIFHDLYCPFGVLDMEKINVRNPKEEKGSVNVVYGKNITVTGCRVSGEGDSTHIAKSENVVFSDNQILGSRMGALYIGFFCKNVTLSGNTVYGTNGSRTLSVERGTEDITIVGNTFTGGGRGCWFNRPKNAVIMGNIFSGNTEKCTPDIQTGRFCHVTGEFEKYPEIYFTSGENDEEYGSVIIKGNIFKAKKGASSAVSFNPGGKNILLEGNIFNGDVCDIHVAKGCEKPQMMNNIGIGEVVEQRFVNTANQR